MLTGIVLGNALHPFPVRADAHLSKESPRLYIQSVGTTLTQGSGILGQQIVGFSCVSTESAEAHVDDCFVASVK